MRKNGRIRRFTVFIEILGKHGCYCHSDPNEAVLVNTRPNDIEPSQATPWRPRAASIPTTASLEPADWQDPWLWLNTPEIVFLFVEIWRNVVTE